ncbi:hypothetical protein V2A60_000121 [Cordyceps javanica]|uniref:cutinase n=1 Tax=Cordyceps javanica TaxID=43265 RepID=A0A545V6A9_9HYPO|nr:cutinase-2 protein [Cordyceps javanica]TQW08498.1 cutinase-2 protein [Cordyceps javanica]
MKAVAPLFLLSLPVWAAAAPVDSWPENETPWVPSKEEVERGTPGDGTPVWRNDFLLNGCADVILFYARNTYQMGNVGRYPGPALAALLEKRYGVKNVAVQGLNYNGGIFPNVKAQGTEDKAIALLKHLITDAFFACRKSKIVVAAYGQGACAVHAAFETLDADILERVNGVVTFGDPRKVQHNNKIPNYPVEKTLFICNSGDTFCEEGLMIWNLVHGDYERRAPEAARFLIEMMDQA